jgi:hypothetical protein
MFTPREQTKWKNPRLEHQFRRQSNNRLNLNQEAHQMRQKTEPQFTLSFEEPKKTKTLNKLKKKKNKPSNKRR